MSREHAFSNSTMYEIWAANWCHRCQRDAIFRNMGKGSGCPILCGVMATNHVPPEWLIQDDVLGDYHCIEFRGPGDGNPEPKPRPEPPQDGLFQRPERGTRMLLPLAEPVPAGSPGAGR
jgi:hypothetical protein